MKSLKRMLRDSSGASAAEYALILAIVGAALALAAFTLGDKIANSMTKEGEKVEQCAAGSC